MYLPLVFQFNIACIFSFDFWSILQKTPERFSDEIWFYKFYISSVLLYILKSLTTFTNINPFIFSHNIQFSLEVQTEHGWSEELLRKRKCSRYFDRKGCKKSQLQVNIFLPIVKLLTCRDEMGSEVKKRR